jgi:hypothetical protein
VRQRSIWGPAAVTALVSLGAAPAGAQVRVGSEFQINVYTTSNQVSPSVAAGGTGNFVVVWRSNGQDGSYYAAIGRRYDASGAPIGGEFQANTYTTGRQTLPVVASDSTGRFVVSWMSPFQDGDGYGVFAQRYDATGARLGGEFLVNTYTTSHQAIQSMAMRSNGDFILVWRDASKDGSGDGVIGQRFSSAGARQGGEFQVNSYTTSSQTRPSIAMDPNGNFVVVWQSDGQDGDSTGIFGRRFNSVGAAQGADFQVNSYATSYQAYSNVGVDGTGNFVVVWQSFRETGGGYGVFGRRFNASAVPQGAEFHVNVYTTGAQQHPRVAVDAAGTFTVVWEGDTQDGSAQGVFGRVFSAAGAAQGGEFLINSYTTGGQYQPSIASNGDRTSLVAWQNQSPQDGNSFGVFGQRLVPDLIFADGFESGNLSAWSIFSDTGGGDLSASVAGALGGSSTGLQAVVNDTAPLYVRDDSPNGEGRYRARFYFDPNAFDPGEAQNHRRTRIFIAFDESPVKRHIAVVLRRVSGQFSIESRVRVDDNSQFDTGFFNVTDAPHFVEMDWQRASTGVSGDGSFQMWIDGASVSTLTNLQNNTRTVDFVRLGPQSLKGGAVGTLYFDEFESRRRSMVGP